MRGNINFICVRLQNRHLNRLAVWLLIIFIRTPPIIANSNHKDAEKNVIIFLICLLSDVPKNDDNCNVILKVNFERKCQRF